MIIIAGLGNPTKEYEGTRHNVGFQVIDKIAEKYNIAVDAKKGRAYVGKGIIEGQKVLLVKPQTYMNLSGESIRELVGYFKVDPKEELLVIYDDIRTRGRSGFVKKEVPVDITELKILLPSLGQIHFKELKSEWEKSRKDMIWLPMFSDIFMERIWNLWKRDMKRQFLPQKRY